MTEMSGERNINNYDLLDSSLSDKIDTIEIGRDHLICVSSRAFFNTRRSIWNAFSLVIVP